MEIILGKTAGFCYGVKRAVEGTKKELNKTEKYVYCLGELIHNKQVLKTLENEGLIIVENINESKGKTIIRAHGVPKEVYNIAKIKNMELEDFTCPNVLKVHKIADEYSNKGYYIFLCGNKRHPENIGTISYCNENYCIIESRKDIEYAIQSQIKSKINKVLLISQTTFNSEEFNVIEDIIRNKLNSSTEFIVKNTICSATEIRQEETIKIAQKVDFMIIIGGKNSSNTKKLYEIASENCKNCVCIETIDELKLEKLNNCNKVGIMAGASTPKDIIEDAVKKIKNV